MKISISWVFDHIDADWRKLDMAKLAELFIQTTAEIDRVYKVEIDTKNLFSGQIKTVDSQISLHVPELQKEFALLKRSDAKEGGWYLITVEGDEVRWATLADVGGSKEGLIGEVNKDLFRLRLSGSSDSASYAGQGFEAKLEDGTWKKSIETLDYIFELDNKSINHRPDLWGHRGVAREMAAMLGLKLKPLEPMLAKFEIVQYQDSCAALRPSSGQASEDQPFAISIQDLKKCSRFAATYMHDVQNRPSDLGIALRLARLDARPIDAIVDATNYVMFDLGHPMHAFDAQKIDSDVIEVRSARKGEKIKLRDGEEYALSPEDLVVAAGPSKLAESEDPDKRSRVIASDKAPLGLAGIMGGAASAVSSETTELLLEAAWFDATMIRKSAERAKKRTEASARFEKNLDPNGNVYAVRRFAKLLTDLHVPHKASTIICSLGQPAIAPEIVVSHEYIEKRLGTQLEPEKVVELLERVEFEIKQSLKTSGRTENDVIYKITVPTFRATKDIQGKQDLVEEVGRLYGYHNITPELPTMQLAPSDLHMYNQLNTIKETCAFVCNMREVANYNFFDEAFIQSIGYEPGETLVVRSPVSQNWQRLVTSLVPNMLKGIQENSADCDQLRFFELGRIYKPGSEISETKSLAGILFEKKKDLTFYDGKAVLSDLFERLALPVSWHKVNTPSEGWFTAYQAAHIKHGDTVIGTAGMMPNSLLHKLSEGTAFVFELDADFLLAYRAPVKRFAPLPKFQPIVRDISLLVPLDQTVDEMAAAIANVDERIRDVALVDFLDNTPRAPRGERNESKRAATLRFAIYEESKTLTKPEIDAIVQQVSDVVTARGAVIR